MAKNISLLGADYPDVPAVQLPQTGGGAATFYDINVIDSLDSDSSTDALSAKQGKVLNEKVSKFDSSIQVTSLDSIPCCSSGRVFLSASISPAAYSTDYWFNYICFGGEINGAERTTLIITDVVMSDIYVINKSGSGWSAWKKINLT